MGGQEARRLLQAPQVRAKRALHRSPQRAQLLQLQVPVARGARGDGVVLVQHLLVVLGGGWGELDMHN